MISVIIPVFNEEKSLWELYTRLTLVLKKEKFEIVFINDGSTDNSLKIIKKIKQKDERVFLINFRRNQGKSNALIKGFEFAKGDKIVTIDADLQDRPEEIPKLVNKLDEGFDLVSGWKKKRNDPFLNVIFSRVFNQAVRAITKVNLHDMNCGLKAYKKEVIDSLNLYGDLYRFIPVLAAKEGYKVGEVIVSHDPRKYGKSKYGFSKFLKGFFDFFTVIFLINFKSRPFHLFGGLGMFLFGIGVLICLYLTVLWLQGQTIGRRPLLILGILLIIIGIQLFTSGLLAELMVSQNQAKDKSEAKRG